MHKIHVSQKEIRRFMEALGLQDRVVLMKRYTARHLPTFGLGIMPQVISFWGFPKPTDWVNMPLSGIKCLLENAVSGFTKKAAELNLSTQDVHEKTSWIPDDYIEEYIHWLAYGGDLSAPLDGVLHQIGLT